MRDSQRDRVAGILLHPTSLPGPWGSGDFGVEAEAFISWAADAGFGLWQILPITPPAAGCSPYTSLSAFAMHPLLISIDRLVDDGLLATDEISPFRQSRGVQCDMTGSEKLRTQLLRQAFARFRELSVEPEIESANPSTAVHLWVTELQAFRAHPLQQSWLEDWCLFAALRREVSDKGWWTWDKGIAQRDPEALAAARKQHAEGIDFERFLQFLAFRQWTRLRQIAHSQGIRILGDLPIYVAYDSADVWVHPELFELDNDLKPLKVAGVPPDYFSEHGQLWGNPLYRWDRMAEQGFQWWVDRLRMNLHMADAVRLDHFRAFASYWEVEADAETARDGRWLPGPGRRLFEAFATELGDPLPLVAEDLGDISDDVHELRRGSGLPCMRVLQFGFEPIDSDHAPHRLREDTLLYTGTHDNDTTLGWFGNASDEVRNLVRSYSGGTDESALDDLIRLAYTSVARWAVIPMQDALRLGSEARMNVPGVAEGNWGWRMVELPDADSTGRFRWLAEISGRLQEL